MTRTTIFTALAALALVGCADATFDIADEETSSIGVRPMFDGGDAGRDSNVTDTAQRQDAGASPDTITPPDASPTLDTSPTPDTAFDTTPTLDTSPAGDGGSKPLYCGDGAGYYHNAQVACEDLATMWCARSATCGSGVSVETCKATKLIDFGCYKSSVNLVCKTAYSLCYSDISNAACMSGIGSGGSYKLGNADTVACRTVLDQNAARYTYPTP